MDTDSGAFSNLVDLLRQRAAERGEQRAKTFLGDGGTAAELSFARLDLEARAVAALLQERLDPGERALLLYPPGLEFSAAFFGCLYAGVVAVPAPPPDPRRLDRTLPRIDSILTDAQPAVVLTTAALNEAAAGLGGQAPALEALPRLATDALPAPPADLAAGWKRPVIGRDTLAYLQYTSGSTAAPKGVMANHGHVLANSGYIRDAWGYRPESTALIWVPNFHDDGLIHGTVQPVFTGFHSIRMAPLAVVRRPTAWLAAITAHRATHSGGPNFAYELCLRKVSEEERQELDLSSWEVAYNAAEPIRPETLHRFRETFGPCGFRWTTFYPSFGMAETTLLISTKAPGAEPVLCRVETDALEHEHRVVPAAAGAERSREVVGCGRPVGEARILIVDPVSRRPCPEDGVGEVWIADPSVASGYWRREEATAETFGAHLADAEGGQVEGPFLRTGDLGFLRGGELFITGRLKDLIIIRGRNIYPQDVELTAEACHPDLRPGCGAAVSVEADGEERLVVAQEVARGFDSAAAFEVIGAVREAVAETHEVEAWDVVLLAAGSLPKTSSGKIQRGACRQAYLSGSLDEVARARAVTRNANEASPAQAPCGPTPASPDGAGPSAAELARWMTAHLAERLGIEPRAVDPRQPFARFGLGSAAMVELAAGLEDRLGRSLPQTLAFDHPTIEALSRFLGRSGPGEPGVATSDRGAAAAAPRDSVREPAIREPTVREPIAIVGMACRFPGADSPQELWRMLADGVDAVGEVPEERWSLEQYYDPDPRAEGKMSTRWGGFLRDRRAELFDPYFFGISPREAESMDPQQRLLLEVAWEALEDAGIPPQSLAGSPTGVFVGIGLSDYGRWLYDQPVLEDAYAGTGGALSIAANRISYQLDLRGPSLAVDTACSASLVAVLQACRSLWSGESRLALAGGVNLVLAPEVTVTFSKAGFMAPDGRSKAFDSRADGYVRGEGAGVVVLKPLSAALADGDPIYALVRGGAVNQDGRSNGLTAPNQQAQEAMLRQAYADAGVSPGEVQYVEAHGTGTALGDPIEAQALGAVLAEGRSAGSRCALGSIKTNLGHLETAAGIAGVIKTALSLRAGELVPSLHFEEPNPRIPFDALPLAVVTERGPWPAAGRRLAGVSSFGFGGTNAHLVLEGPPERPAAAVSEASRALLVPLSAHGEDALRQRAADLVELLHAPEVPSLADLAYTASRRRGHQDQRMAVVARGAEELRRELEGALAGEESARLAAGRRPLQGRPRTVFLFSGHGSQWPAMGTGLLDEEPVFRHAFERCAAAISHCASFSAAEELRAAGDASRVGEIEVAQPLIFAVQVSLAALWRSWGIEPDSVVGHSFGEIAAACVAGAIGLEDAARIVCGRSRLMQSTSGRGTMLAVDLAPADAEAALASLGGELAARAGLAVHASPTSSVLSGDAEALAAVRRHLEEREVYCRAVKVEVAGHSPQMDPLCGPLREELGGLEASPVEIPMLSTVTGGAVEGSELDAGYWARNLRQPVRFAEVLTALLDQGETVFVEVSPHPVVLAQARQTAAHLGRQALTLPSLRREEAERETMLSSLGALYCGGAEVDWAAVQPEGGACVPLPAYPWQRERFWLDRSGRTDRHATSTSGCHPLLGPRAESARSGEVFWQGLLDASAAPFLADHRLKGAMVLPGAAYAEAALAAAAELAGAGADPGAMAVRDLRFERALFVPEEGAALQLSLEPEGSGGAPRASRFTVFGRRNGGNWQRCARGRIVAPDDSERKAGAVPGGLPTVRARCPEEIAGTDFYARLEAAGNAYGPRHRGIDRLWRGADEALARLVPPPELVGEQSRYRLHPALLDAAWQALGAVLPEAETPEKRSAPWVPTGLEEVRIAKRPAAGEGTILWSHARLRAGEGAEGELCGDVTLLDAEGEVVAETRGLAVRRQPIAVPADLVPRDALLYALCWRPAPVPASSEAGAEPGAGSWLILADRGGVAEALGARLEARGEPWLRGDAADLDALPGLLDRALGAEGGCRGIVHLASLDGEEPEAGAGASLVAAAQRRGAESALAVVRELIRREQSGGELPGAAALPRVWWATRGAQAAPEGDAGAMPFSALAHSPLWGLGRVVAQEHPELCGALVDLDPRADATELAEALEAELRGPRDGSEPQVLLRRGGRWVARLARSSGGRGSAGEASGALRRDPEAAYLITGGLGGLGLAVARWMAGRGARHLLLVSRGGLPPRSEWDDPALEPATAAKVSAVREIESLGAQVALAACDAADAEGMRRLLAAYRQAGRPPVRGVVHAAGVLDNHTLARLDAASLQAVLRPKAVGGWILHELFADQELDFFVLFSSAASLLGSAGQANHSAANAFLDGLARYRRSRGLPALAIQWGLWSQIGYAAQAGERAVEQLAAQGFDTIAPALGLEVFGELLAGDAREVGVLPLDRHRLARSGSFFARSPLFAELLAEPAGAGAKEADPAGSESLTLGELQRADTRERPALLEDYLAGLTARTLRIPRPRLDLAAPLTALGLDSLVAVDLKSRLRTDLEAEVPVVKLLQGASVRDLTGELLELLEPSFGSPPAAVESTEKGAEGIAEERAEEGVEAPSEVPAAPPPAEPFADIGRDQALELLERLDNLSDDEVEALLAQNDAGPPEGFPAPEVAAEPRMDLGGRA